MWSKKIKILNDSGNDKQAMLAALRQRIRHLDPGVVWHHDSLNSPVCPLSVPLRIPSIDHSLPGGGLYAHALHEVVAGDASCLSEAAARAAASGFAAFLLARLAGHAIKRWNFNPVLWCCMRRPRRRAASLYVPGLDIYGLDHASLLIARGMDSQEVLWTMEEGLSSCALAAVIGEPGFIDSVALRRLQLAAETGRTGAVLLLSESAQPAATTAFTRWRISPLPLPATQGNCMTGFPRFHWRVELLKCRGGRPDAWTLTEDDLDFSPDKPLEHSTHGDIPAAAPGLIPLAGGIRHRPVSQIIPATAPDRELRRTG